MDMVILANKLAVNETPKPGNTIINANNVQVNQGVEKTDLPTSKEDLLKKLAGE